MLPRPLDALRARLYVGGAGSGGTGGLWAPIFVVLTAGCATSAPPPPAPTVDAEQVALRMERRTRPEAPTRAVFGWEMNESGSRLSGRGVVRMEPPYRVRLDLFLDNGETAARAALVEDELRLPPGVDRRLIPPPPLLWASLGVFHPGPRARLLDGRARDGGVRLRYGLSGGEELRYRLRDGRLRAAELLRDGDVVERVELDDREDGATPPGARYRDLSAFRELRVSIESTERVESYPPEIWHPAR